MDSKSRKQIERIAIEEKIVDAAVVIILEEGIEKLSIRKIAERIGYAVGTIYNYYKNKDDILTSISTRVFQEVMEEITTLLAKYPEQTPVEKLRACNRTFIRTMIKYPEKFKAVMMASRNDPIPEEGEEEAGIDLLQALINEGITEGCFTSANQHSAELMLIGLMGLVYHIVSTGLSGESAERMAEQYIEMLIQALN
ncbi:TetR/AcrR family transcriptional regulator [Enterococcus sp. LJL128]|uniref:TetR/AcrR family transcriptional regulator n=1 Tax=Enterococcus sp. LJL51 TaxID=3416656 RepID=UPI003CE85410